MILSLQSVFEKLWDWAFKKVNSNSEHWGHLKRNLLSHFINSTTPSSLASLDGLYKMALHKVKHRTEQCQLNTKVISTMVLFYGHELLVDQSVVVVK